MTQKSLIFIRNVWLYVAISMVLLALMAVYSSCRSVFKTEGQTKSDSTAVRIKDSGKISTETEAGTKDSKWQRETFEYPQFPRDTNVFNITNNVPANPIRYIRETGEQKETYQRTHTDTLFDKLLEIWAKKEETKTESKEVKNGQPWWLTFLAIGGFVLGTILVVLKLYNKISITKI